MENTEQIGQVEVWKKERIKRVYTGKGCDGHIPNINEENKGK